jgi:ABC-type transport system involved in multi-copper enzyme maturation permease subunit
MLLTIVRQELLDHIMSLRFSAIFVLTVALMVTSTLVSSVRHVWEVKEYPAYAAGLVESDGKVNLMMVACQGGSVKQYPSALSFCANVGESTLPNRVVMAVQGIQGLQRSAQPGDMFGGSGSLDWLFVVSVVLSFGAGLLTYKTISGERRDGTLSLILANPVPRGNVLLGKYLAALFALTSVFLVGVLTSVIALQLSGNIQITFDDWLKVAGFTGVSIVYLSSFVLAGMVCSVVARSPVLSAVAFLFFWTIVVFVVPNLGGILASEFGKAPTPLQVHERARGIPDQYSLSAGMGAAEMDAVKLRRESAREQLVLGYLQELAGGVELAKNLTRVSPASTYAYASEDIVGAGTFRMMHFAENAVRFRQRLLQAIIDADKKDPRSEHRFVPWWCGGDHFSQQTVDIGEAKEFHDVPPTSGAGFAAAGLDILLLIVYNLIAFAVAFWRFIRQDVAVTPGV